ncbi:uncharacterized protein G2W53_012743 [Senna tora]|uniref:Uncharacterized protein n=1 Tax=Senna tora TaxID=362788 RepID=A0A834U1P9_9FABA|nr:uncharacterized protein G2W53_012743 [Senna tora]
MRIEASGPGLTRAATCALAFFDSSADENDKLQMKSGGDHALPVKVFSTTSSSSTSSIGRNSDLSSETSMGDEDCGENEVQSAYNGPLDMMQPLEEVLPISRGISKFYNGKSKSFTSLADASASASAKDIAKPQNGFTRKRRNLMALNHVWHKNRSLAFIRSHNNNNNNNNGGISKRTILRSSRSTLALAVAMNNSDSNSSFTSDDSNNSMSPPPPLLPPLHPPSSSSPLQHNFSAWKSFSFADLQHCSAAATINISTSSSLTSEAALTKLT